MVQRIWTSWNKAFINTIQWIDLRFLWLIRVSHPRVTPVVVILMLTMRMRMMMTMVVPVDKWGEIKSSC